MNLYTLYTVIGAMFILLICGYVARKMNIVDDVVSKNLTNLVLKIAQPALIMSALLSVEYTPEMLKQGAVIFLVGLLIQIILAIPAFFIGKTFKDVDKGKITEFSLLFTNCGFIGLPVLSALFGDIGLFLGAMYQLTFYFSVWSWGVSIFARKREDIKLTWKKIFFNHGMISAYIGIALFLINMKFPIPEFFTKSLSYLSGICTPITLIIAGALIAKLNFKQIFLSAEIYIQSAVKLFIIPLTVALLTSLCRLDDLYVMFFTAVTALPSASMVAMFAETYDTKQSFASLIVGASTLFSIISIPVIMNIADWICKVI